MSEEIQEILRTIRDGAPAACELDCCTSIKIAIRRLLEFAWKAVTPQEPTRQAGTLNKRINDLIEKRGCYLSAHEHAELNRLLIEDYKQRKESEVSDEPTARTAE